MRHHACSALCLAFIVTPLLFVLPASSFAYGLYKGANLNKPRSLPILSNGFYVGLSAGYDAYRTRPNINFNFNGDTITGSPALSSTGFVGGIFGGYGEYYKNLAYLGGEAFVNISGASSSSTYNDAFASSIYNNKINGGTSLGFAVLPGIKLSDSSLFYLRFGVTWANIKGQENINVAGVSTSTSKNSWDDGFAYGLGLETALCYGFSLRSEYSHTNYNNFTSNTFDTTYSPSDDQFMMGLIYHLY